MSGQLPLAPFLYPILDWEFSANLLVDCEDVIRAGVKVLQVRAKNQSKRSLYDVTGEIAALCRDRNVCCLINDHVDIALVTDVNGIHLGQLDFPAAESRALLPDKIIGLSTHNAEQFRIANHLPVDYVAIGPVFQTSTKRTADAALGPSLTGSIAKTKIKPVVAIGGIRSDQVASIARLNVDGIAVISAIYRDGKVYDNASRMLEELRKR